MNRTRAQLAVDAFAAVMVASVALALGALVARLAGYTGQAPVATPVAPRPRAAPVDPAALLALAPFGTAQSAGTATSGPLRLKGILLAIPASASTALIAGADGKVASYAVGAPINGGVVDAIESDRVIVRMPGGSQVLAFAPLVGGNIPAGSPLGKPGPTTGVPESPPDTGGLRVSALAPPMLFATGLRPGDVIERLNGSPVSTGMTERDVIARVMQAGAAQVVVMRNGQRVSLNLAIH